MPALKLGLQLSCLKLPLKQSLITAHRLGVQAVEINARNELRPRDLTPTALREFRKLLSDLNLKVCAVRYQTRRGYNNLAELEARIDGTKQAMRMAQSLGASWVINQIGHIPEDLGSATGSLLTQALTDLGNFGQHYGALLAAETGPDSPDALRRLLDNLPSGLLGLDFNPANLIMHGYSPMEVLQATGSSIFHVHLNDAVHDIARGRGQEMPIGHGSADIPALLGALEEHDYRGWFTLQQHESSQPVEDFSDAIELLRSY